MRSSLHSAFVGIWLFIVASCVALAVLMQGLYHLGTDARADTVAARVDRAAIALRTRFGLYAKSYPTAPDFSDEQRRRELGLILQIVLEEYEDVEGGFYAPQAGFLAYAFPSYEGSGTKQDVPAAESARIAALAQHVIDSGKSDTERTVGARQTLILESVPVGSVDHPLAVWVMSRAHVRADDGSRRLLVGLAWLGFFVLASGAVLLMVLRRWNRALAELGRGIADAPAGQAWQMQPTGHRDLDQVATMVSSLHRRLDEQHRTAVRLENELARAQRVATVGRMTAQLVHEIRNPIAAMRLRAENALAGAGDARIALDHILKDVHRLDDLLERLQATTRLNALRLVHVPVDRWLADVLEPCREQAANRRVAITLDAPAATWPFDPTQLARAVDNLVANAVQHVRSDTGEVVVTAAVELGVLCRIAVDDNGPGIAAESQETIFDPFHTTRADGTGLGLSIAREIVEAHGGTLRAVPTDRSSSRLQGAHFVIELPWPAS